MACSSLRSVDISLVVMNDLDKTKTGWGKFTAANDTAVRSIPDSSLPNIKEVPINLSLLI